jgi:hypothetical protein
MQTITLPAAFATDTLTSIDFNSFGQGGFGSPFVAAIDAFPAAAVPGPVVGAGLPGLVAA